jgi:hypothetical protein
MSESSKKHLSAAFMEIGCNVNYWSNDTEKNHTDLVDALLCIKEHLCGLSADTNSTRDTLPPELIRHTKNPVVAYADKIVSLYHSDDLAQANDVHIGSLPSGWKQFSALYNHIKNCPENSVCILEEPETHLHPELQRILAKKIGDKASKKGIQFFIATHSTTFLSSYTWPESSETKFFEATGEMLHEGINNRRLLDALGINGVDQGQSNGIIWVEGPSDRTYLKHWIHLYCKTTNTVEPVEGIHYMFQQHGGSLLTHYAVGENSLDKIDLLKLNRNFAILMDGDGDGDLTITPDKSSSNGKQAKVAIVAGIEKQASKTCRYFVTPGYTIESSLPEKFRLKFFGDKNGRLIHKQNLSKFLASQKYTKEFKEWGSCFDQSYNMNQIVEGIVKVIYLWNSGAIEAAH